MPTPTGAPATTTGRCGADRHGTASAYRRGCRCDIARKAIARYENQRRLDGLRGRSRTLSNIGAIRRLHALRALGWPSRDLAARIGVDERNIARWPHRNWISRAHHDAVCRVYDDLGSTRGPDERARRHAARQGWLPPIWWDDDRLDDPEYDPRMVVVKDFHECKEHDLDPIAIERAIAGDRSVTLTRPEKTEAVRQLLTAGVGVTDVSRRLGINGQYVRIYAERAGVVLSVSPMTMAGDGMEVAG